MFCNKQQQYFETWKKCFSVPVYDSYFKSQNPEKRDGDEHKTETSFYHILHITKRLKQYIMQKNVNLIKRLEKAFVQLLELLARNIFAHIAVFNFFYFFFWLFIILN